MSDCFRIPSSLCPTCRYTLDAATVADRRLGVRKPLLGDFTLCACCGEILVYEVDMSKRVAGVNDMLNLDPVTSQTLDRAQKLIRKMRLVKPK